MFESNIIKAKRVRPRVLKHEIMFPGIFKYIPNYTPYYGKKYIIVKCHCLCVSPLYRAPPAVLLLSQSCCHQTATLEPRSDTCMHSC